MAPPARPHAEVMKVAYLLYPRFTALDVVGTFQVLAAAPGIQSVFVATSAGSVIDDTGLCALQAAACLRDVVSADVVVVPGSDYSCDLDPALVEWLRIGAPDDDVDAQRRYRVQLPRGRGRAEWGHGRHALGVSAAPDRRGRDLQRAAGRAEREGPDLGRRLCRVSTSP